MPLALVFVAAILAVVELVKSKAQSLIAWGLLALACASIPWLR